MLQMLKKKNYQINFVVLRLECLFYHSLTKINWPSKFRICSVHLHLGSSFVRVANTSGAVRTQGPSDLSAVPS